MANRQDISAHDVFISWTGADTALKQKIADSLKRKRLTVLLSDEQCQGDFEEWSREAATSAHIFLTIVTDNALNSDGMTWELKAIGDKLCNNESEKWEEMILPICQNLDVFQKYKDKFPPEAQKKLKNLSAITFNTDPRTDPGTDLSGKLTEKCLDEIYTKAVNRIISRFHTRYLTQCRRNHIKLISLLMQNVADKQYNFDDLYVPRSITEIGEDGQPLDSYGTPEPLLSPDGVSFVHGTTGCGKTQYIHQIRRYAGDTKLVLSLSCAKIAEKTDGLFDLMYREYHRLCGERDFYTKDNFRRTLNTIPLILILDGMDEIASQTATRHFVEKIERYYETDHSNLSLIFTSRNEKDGALISFGTKRSFRLELLEEDEVETLGNNLFRLFKKPEKGTEFYDKVKNFNDKIRKNPLLLSQLALVYHETNALPNTIVGILSAVFDLVLNTDHMRHEYLAAIPNRYRDMVEHDVNDILNQFARNRYEKKITNPSQREIVRLFGNILRNKYEEDDSACQQRISFLLDYLHKRAILVEDDFYHKMFLEYFAARAYFEDTCSEYDDPKSINVRAVQRLFSHYHDEYWSSVIKLFLIKADSVLNEEEVCALYHVILNDCDIRDYTLLLEICKEPLTHPRAAREAIALDLLIKSADGRLPAYGPLFWYVPTYGLTRELLLAAWELSGNEKALALTRDVCFLFGKYTAADVTDEVDGTALFHAAKEKLTGVRYALCSLFYTGEGDVTIGAKLYPRCFNTAEAHAFMTHGHGAFGRMDAAFEDELGLFSHETYPEVNGEYIGFLSCPYHKETMEQRLNQKSCAKVSVLALTPTENEALQYIAFLRSSIRVFYIAENIRTIEAYAFSHMPLELLTVEIDENNRFYAPKGIRRITLPKDLLVLKGSFSEFQELEDVILPKGLLEIGDDAFLNCKKLAIHKLPETLQAIGDRAFYGCTGITIDRLPDGLTEIGDGAFLGCTGITIDRLPHGLTEIEAYSFAKCPGITIDKLPDGLTEIGDHAFQDCIGITIDRLPDKLAEIGDHAFQNCTGITIDRLPDGLNKIGFLAFQGCTKITEMQIEKFPKISWPSYNIFSGCTNLKRVIISQNHRNQICRIFDPSNQIEYICLETRKPFKSNDINSNTLTISKGVKHIESHAYSNQNIEKVVFPNTLRSIGKHAFEKCINLTEITLPPKIVEIGDYAFYQCFKLSIDEFPKKLRVIGDCAFSSCAYISSIKFSNSLKKIGDHAFYSCHNLSSIELPNSLTEIGIGAFAACSNITSVKFPDNLTKIKDFTFALCSNITSIKFSDSLTEIENNAFLGCTNITIDKFPPKISRIDAMAFKECINITIDTLPEGLTELGLGAFEGCTGITKMELPKNLLEIRAFTFINCTNLRTIHIPESVTSIGFHAFAECSSLESVAFHSRVKCIDAYAYHNCVSLRELRIPTTVAKIGDGAFVGCTGLTSVEISANFRHDVARIFGDIDPEIIHFI